MNRKVALLNSVLTGLMVNSVLFLRGDMLPFSVPFGTGVIPFVIAFLIIVFFILTGYVEGISVFTIAALSFSIFPSFTYGVLFSDPLLTARFFLEIFGCLLLAYSVYLYSNYFGYDVAIKNISYSVVIGAALYSILMIMLLLEKDNVRRIGALDGNLEIAAHHLAVSFLIAASSAIYIILTNRKKILNIFLVMFFVYFIFLSILTGSKAGFGSLIISLFIVGLFKIKNSLYAFVVIFMLFAFMMFGFSDKFIMLVNRFDVGSYYDAFNLRLETFDKVIQSWNGGLLGEPSRYEPISSSGGIHYPHNIFLSVMVHLGFISLFFFSIYVFIIYIILISSIKFADKCSYPAVIFLFISFNAAFINHLFSARLTRDMTIFVLIGLILSFSNLRHRFSSYKL